MRKLVLTALLLVLVGAVSAAWLSSTTPEGSSVGDINLAEERTPGSGATGLDVPPRQGLPIPARSYAGGSGSTATLPESSTSVPAMTIASSNIPTARVDIPIALRRYYPGGSDSFRKTPTRPNTRSSGSTGFSALGFGGGGVGGGGGASATATGAAATRKATTFTTLTGKPIEKTPAATPAPAARPTPRPSTGGGSSNPPASGSAPAPPAAAAAPAFAAAPAAGAGLGTPIGTAGSPAGTPIEGAAGPFSPGGSPSPAATPEPTTMLLLGTGLAGLYRLRRRLE